MLTFEPDSPWDVGQIIAFYRDGELAGYKVVVSVEHSDDHSETQYELRNHPVTNLRYFLEAVSDA